MTKDKIFVGVFTVETSGFTLETSGFTLKTSGFTLETSGFTGVTVLLLGECMEVIPSQQDRDFVAVGQLADSCALPLLVQHYIRECRSLV